MSLKIIGSFVGFAGVIGGGITAASLSQTVTLNSNFAERENCTVTSVHYFPRGFSIEGSKYTAIYCGNTNSKGSRESIANRWTGLFPKALLKSGSEELKIGTKFNLETDTQLLDGSSWERKTTFRGDKFLNSPVSGTWKFAFGQPIPVTLSEGAGSQEKIYILFT